jgi:hypothetical protein
MRTKIEPLGPPLEEPLTPTQLEALARIVPGDEEATLWPGYISAARQQAEHDTERIFIATPCLITVASDDAPWSWPDVPTPGPQQKWIDVPIPGLVREVQAATLRTVDGRTQPFVALTQWRIVRERLQVYPPPSGADRIEFEATLGRPDAATFASLDPILAHAVNVLAVHYVTSGRDMVAVGLSAEDMPFSYRDAIQAYRLESLA